MSGAPGAAAAATRLEILIALGAVADGARPLDDGLPDVLDLLVPGVADLCVVEDAEGRPLAARWAGPGAPEVEAALLRRAADGRGATERPGEREAVLADGDHAAALAWDGDGAGPEPLRGLDAGSLIAAPLRVHGLALGRLVLATGPGREPFREPDMRFAEAVALRVAQSLDGMRVAALTRELEALVDNMDDAVNVRDLHGRIVLANAASRAMLHAGGPDDPLDLPELWDRFALFDADGRDLRDEDLPWFRLLHGAEHVDPLLMRRVVRGTGEQQWLLVKATAIRDSAGRPVLVMSVTEDVTATRRAEIGQRLLLDAGLALSRSLDVEASLQEVAELVVPALADWCGIDLPGNTGMLEAVAVAHADPDRAARVRELRRRHPVARDGRSPLAGVLRTGEPLRVAGITDEMLRAEATDAEHLALLRETGLTALLAVPVRAGERILGVLMMGSTQSDRRLDDHVLELADALGRRIGEALRNARLYRERDEVAHVLSAGLAPDQALEVAGCEVALRYRPAGEGVEAGGDFYEVIDTPAGPIVVIGDVAGKGAPAAALSAVARVTLRTAGRLTGDPHAALTELNHALRRRCALSLCTVAAVALPQELPGLASVLLAGHPPPLLVRDGQVLAVGRTGPLLGAVEAADWRAEPVEICPGDTLVLYTDGVLDAALPGGERFGEARLRAQVARFGHDPEALIAALDEALAPLRLRDDVAVLAIRCPGVVPLLARDTLDGDAERLLRLTLPGGHQAPHEVRAALRDALAGRVEVTLCSDLLIIASELATNAVRHGGARTPEDELELHLALVGGGVRLEVVDPGPGFDPGGHGPRHDGGYGLHLLGRLAARWGVAGSSPTTVWAELQ